MCRQQVGSLRETTPFNLPSPLLTLSCPPPPLLYHVLRKRQTAFPRHAYGNIKNPACCHFHRSAKVFSGRTGRGLLGYIGSKLADLVSLAGADMYSFPGVTRPAKETKSSSEPIASRRFSATKTSQKKGVAGPGDALNLALDFMETNLLGAASALAKVGLADLLGNFLEHLRPITQPIQFDSPDVVVR